ncbi:dynein light chain Tctex-type protein 2B-like [Physella acuta]|uniref:dynein light chain Tctex-type protein 2B-like n=1 Tax=Physella acuta TaxID=109671 RepID=UPI0027DCE362|nr:dynein light chain Tctex-type protein 2B-like [Physella acuta]
MGEEGSIDIEQKAPVEISSDTAIANSKEANQQNTYIIRPNFSQKFRPINVKEMIHTVLGEKLTGVAYNSEETGVLTKEIAETLKARLKEMGHERYKFVVQVVIGEQRGEGVKMGCRCFWDSDTDNYAQDIFMNDTLFCVAAAYGVFKY